MQDISGNDLVEFSKLMGPTSILYIIAYIGALGVFLLGLKEILAYRRYSKKVDSQQQLYQIISDLRDQVSFFKDQLAHLIRQSTNKVDTDRAIDIIFSFLDNSKCRIIEKIITIKENYPNPPTNGKRNEIYNNFDNFVTNLHQKDVNKLSNLTCHNIRLSEYLQEKVDPLIGTKELIDYVFDSRNTLEEIHNAVSNKFEFLKTESVNFLKNNIET